MNRKPEAAPEAPRERLYGGRSASERRAERRARLLDAGLELFGTLGFHGVTIPMLCAEAGVTARHFYDEFASREALLAEIYDTIARDVFERSRAALRRLDLPLAERIRTCNEAYFHSLTDDPRRARIYALETGATTELEQHRHATRETFVATLTRGLERAETRAGLGSLDARLLAVAVTSAANAVLLEWVLSSTPPSVDAMIDTVSELWMRVLRA